MLNIRLHRLSAALLEAWKSAGHPVGVDTHLRVYRLLEKLPADTPPEALKTLLAPLLCRDKEEQKAFYERFERILQELPPERKSLFLPRFTWWWLLVPLLLSGVFFLIRHVNREKIITPIAQSLPPIRLHVGDAPQPLCMDQDSLRYKMPLIYWVNHVRVENSSGNCIEFKAISVGSDTVLLRYIPKDASIPEKEVIQPFIVLPKEEAAADTSNKKEPLAFKEYQHGTNLSSLIPKSGPQFSFIHSNSEESLSWLTKMAWLTALVALLLIFELFRNLVRFKKTTSEEDEKKQSGTDDAELDKSPNSQGPYSWQLKVPGADRFALEEQVDYIIQMLRRRSEQEALVFDVPRTVDANIRQPGHVSFRYRNPTQIDEYLLLIDIRSRNDHRAQVFDLLFHEFVREEVLAERFFYDGDIRLCWNEKHQNGVSLRDLQHKFGEHRLLIVGSGESLFSPLTGRMERWTEVFDAWKHRSFLSTAPISQWRSQEVELDAKFRLAPATLHGLSWLAGSDAAPDDRDIDYWCNQPDAKYQPLIISDNLSEAAIFAHLDAEYSTYTDRKPDERMLKWIAACAISPVLHWDATLFFGKLVDDNPRYPLLSISNLQDLNRLQWFQEGRMPEKARRVLLAWLNREYPEEMIVLRKSWKKLLEDNLAALQQAAQEAQRNPFEKSVAFEEMRLQMIVNELALDSIQNKVLPLEKRKKLETELQELSQRAPADFVALELLKNAAAAEINLEETINKPEEKDQLPPFLWGWRWQLPIFIVFALNIWTFDGIGTRCYGDQVSYANYPTLCLNGPKEEAALAEQMICDQIEFDTAHYLTGTIKESLIRYDKMGKKALKMIDTSFRISPISRVPQGYFDGLRQLGIDSSSAYLNIGIALWNEGLKAYKQGKADSACIYFNQLRSWPWRDSIVTAQEFRQMDAICFKDMNAGNPVQLTDPKILFNQQGKKPPAKVRRRVDVLPGIDTSATKIPVSPPMIPDPERVSIQDTPPKDSIKPLVLNTTQDVPKDSVAGNFYFRVNKIQVLGKLNRSQSNLTLLRFVLNDKNTQATYWEQYKAVKSKEEYKLILSYYIRSLLSSSDNTTIENVKSKQEITFGDIGWTDQSEKIPENVSLRMGIYKTDAVGLDRRVLNIVNSKDFYGFLGALEKMGGSLNAYEFEKQVVGFILRNYNMDGSSPLGQFEIDLNRAQDYRYLERKREGVQDVYGRFSLDYSIFGYSSPKKN